MSFAAPRDVLSARAERFGDRLALTEGSRTLTHRELSEAADLLAAALLERGGVSDLASGLDGERIAILVEPGIDWVVALWGVWRAGGIAVPLCVSHPVPELLHALGDSEPSLLLASSALEERARTAARGGDVEVRLVGELAAGAASPTETSPLRDRAERGALIVYTSGTTGGPKGALHTHASLSAQVDALLEAWGWSRDDRTVNVLPLHHVHGIVNVVCCALASGARCEMMPGFDPGAIWERFAARELTVFMAVPTIYARLVAAWEAAGATERERWRSGARTLRLMVSGSAALPGSVLERWERATGHRLLERYGMTETGMILSNPLDGERVPGAVGRPLPGVEVRFAGGGEPFVESDDPKALRGEVEVRGPGLFRGYWGREEATREAFTADGWFRTGDVGVLEHDRYRLLGRSSVDILKTGGYKVSALEIEEVLRAHPRIAEVAVVGIPDEEWGQRIAAAVVLCDRGSLELDELREWSKQRLAPYKAPSLLRIVDRLPRNALGKVTKNMVQELFGEG
ncbi:MAG TPA: acyl-CoA synthetase [Thermoanaerobaculia bacterium]|nr:acyl-CoA synthetase [Thermoanaerobaculia bacterium]